jgi:large subunit ribosomal protein L22
MAFTSKWRFARISARKARLVTDLIQNKPVDVALDLLRFNKKRAAVMVSKVLKSAIANADAQEADTESLIVVKAFCDDGPVIKRFQPKDRGKAYDIKKRTCHITVEVDEGVVKPKKTKRKAAKNNETKEAASAAEQK